MDAAARKKMNEEQREDRGAGLLLARWHIDMGGDALELDCIIFE
jgi:hypothetical protein